MGTTKIEWTEKTWNCVRGCSRISEGCRNCYAEKIAARFCGSGDSATRGEAGGELREEHVPAGPFNGFIDPKTGRWNGRVELVESMLDGPGTPRRTRKPTTWFVNSMSDLFHEALSEGDIRRVFRAMQQAHWHTYQILTKRSGRMADVMPGVLEWLAHFAPTGQAYDDKWNPKPLPNVWLGVSVENRAAKHRIDTLRAVPAAVRFLSLEPLLEDLGKLDLDGISWVIVGGESGPGARPMHPDWARSLRDQCVAAGVPFFFKQWGEWSHGYLERVEPWAKPHACEHENAHWPNGKVGQGSHTEDGGLAIYYRRVGKKAAGRRLDGRTWDQMPEVAR
jgi:protein gp37